MDTQNSLESDALYFEYTSSANPLAAKIIERIPTSIFPAALHKHGPTRSIDFDLSEVLQCQGPATSPGLRARFLRILAGERLAVDPKATSMLFHVFEGGGKAIQGLTCLSFAKGDFFVMPGGDPVGFLAESTARIYAVDDEPLLRYLGVRPDSGRFVPTLYPASRVNEELRAIASDPKAPDRNRISLLLGNARFPQTRTVTHTLWAMLGIVPPRSSQKPHRHQSVALDFVSQCSPGCYSLAGLALGADGEIINPTRICWEEGMAFVTPPGMWHAHFNESDEEAFIVPIQDAGLHTHLRTLDIRFA